MTTEQIPIAPDTIETLHVRNVPIVAPPSWAAAVKAAGGQCQDERETRGSRKARRCTRTLYGGHKLYLWTDGRVYCGEHFDDHRLGRR